MSRTYSRSNMMAMQQDAIRRVQEMQRRSQQKLSISRASGDTDSRQQERSEEPVHKEKPANLLIQPEKEVAKPSPIETILKDLNIDKDRIIILALIIVLLNEGGDKMLLLALFYILV